MLAADLIRSLFCGLPRQDKRMAVFVAACDETSSGTHLSHFFRTGFLAPERDWSDWFAPAWQERVLDGPPSIPYLHMTDIRSAKFRAKHGLSEGEAERRVNEAFRVVTSMGSLFPIAYGMNAGHLKDVFKEITVVGKTQSGQTSYSQMEPDYLSFIAFALAVLAFVKEKRPECEKVDFIVERNGRMTERIKDFHDCMPAALAFIGEPALIPILGELIPGGKERVPLQAADLLCWYTRRFRDSQLSNIDMQRYGLIATRNGHLYNFTNNEIAQMGTMK